MSALYIHPIPKLMKPKLFCTYLSPYARKVIVVLALKKTDYKLVPVSPFDAAPEGWREISPLGKIPAWQDEHVTLADSTVICEYLDEICPEPALYPTVAAARARCRWFEEYADTAMSEAMVQKVFANRVIKPLFRKIPGDTELANLTLEREIPPILDYLESRITGKEYLVDNRFSMADLSVVCPLINLQLADAHFDSQRWPDLNALYERITAVDAVKNCLDREIGIIQRQKDRSGG